jgi:hypothetical protein
MVLSERLELRLDEETVDAVDEWRAKQQGQPSRSEAIRQLIDRGLSGRGGNVQVSTGERLAVLMLCDVLKALPSRPDREFDPEVVKEIVGGGHLWALKSEYSWAFNREMDNPLVVDEVYEILFMWEQIEDSFGALEPAQKQQVLKEVGIAETPRYEGFDGKNDDHYGIAFFIIKRSKEGRFDRFEKALNSHSRGTLPMYRRMLEIYKTIEPTGRHLSASQLVEIFKARIHPHWRGKQIPQ